MRGSTFVPVLLGLVLIGGPSCSRGGSPAAEPGAPLPDMFTASDHCRNCHDGLTDSAGNDISFGNDWRGSMMAHAALDPYWLGSVRREALEHPGAAAVIEHECARCHMPMDHYQVDAGGGQAGVFRHTGNLVTPEPKALFALDGVSCVVCHQITPDGLGDEASFGGRFEVDQTTPTGERIAHGPYAVDAGRSDMMRAASGFAPGQVEHGASSELCASCHTLYTHALGPDGEVVGELPEQVPFLEWKHSSFADSQGCVSCHMERMKEPVSVSTVLTQDRTEVDRHLFRGGNFVVPQMFVSNREVMGPLATSAEFDAVIAQTREHLQTRAATVEVVTAEVTDGRLLADVRVTNLAGHKLPTAYPSRRAWLHVAVRDRAGTVVFESGALGEDGSIVGNDNDADGARFEPHHAVVSSPDQVAIYEAILGAPDGAVTTGLLTATQYLKDNRILPDGFDESTASPDIAVKGAALQDADHTGGADTVRYEVDLGSVHGPLELTAELWYQPIGFRWAHNLADHGPVEPLRFVEFYEAQAADVSIELAGAEATIAR